MLLFKTINHKWKTRLWIAILILILIIAFKFRNNFKSLHSNNNINNINNDITRSPVSQHPPRRDPGMPTVAAVWQEETTSWSDPKPQLEKEFGRRREWIETSCKSLYIQPAFKMHLGAVNPYKCEAKRKGYGFSECLFGDHFPLARSASSLTCLINKVASTSVISALMAADGAFQPPNGTELLSAHAYIDDLKAKSEQEFAFAAKHFFKFLIVRHPFRRLLSAYKDKIETANHWSLVELRADIQDFTYKLNSYAPTKSKGISNKENVKNKTHTNLNETRIPTFEEFLKYILQFHLHGIGFDSHWVPYWKHCAPCSLHYDVIAKLENGYSELEYIWTRMGFKERDSIPWENKSNGTRRKEDKMLSKYYGHLSVEIIMDIYKSFLLDFKLFEYSIHDVLKLGNHCSTDEDCKNIIMNHFHYIP